MKLLMNWKIGHGHEVYQHPMAVYKLLMRAEEIQLCQHLKLKCHVNFYFKLYILM